MSRRDSIALYLRLLGHVRPHWRPFALAVFAMVISAAAQPAIPMILKPVLDGSFIDRDSQAVAGLTVLLVLAFVVWAVANWTRAVAFSAVSQRVLIDLRTLMFEKLMALPIGGSDRPYHPAAHVEADVRRRANCPGRKPIAGHPGNRPAGRGGTAGLDGVARLAAFAPDAPRGPGIRSSPSATSVAGFAA